MNSKWWERGGREQARQRREGVSKQDREKEGERDKGKREERRENVCVLCTLCSRMLLTGSMVLNRGISCSRVVF